MCVLFPYHFVGDHLYQFYANAWVVDRKFGNYPSTPISVLHSFVPRAQSLDSSSRKQAPVPLT